MPRIPTIYLDSRDVIMWKRPPKKGYYRLPDVRNASTEIIESMGMDTLEDEVGEYRIHASAAKYLANIRRLDRENEILLDGEDFGREPKKAVIFSGGIQIYKEGLLPGTEIEGFDLEKQGRIWTAKRDTRVYRSPSGFKDVIWGKAVTKDGMVRRIRGIIRGYEEQERARERSRSDALNRQYKRGQRDQHENEFGTFSPRPMKGPFD